MLISPIEILNYLKWRKYVYADSPTIDTSIYFDEKENISITNLRNKEGLPLQFLHQKYGMDVVKQDNNYLRMFSEYLNVLSEHVVSESEKNSYYQMILFLAHLDRIEIGAFVERIKIAADCNNKGEKTICGSIRNINQNRVIFFSSAREFCDTDFLISLVRKNGMEPKYLLQVIVYYECKQEYRIDMKLWSATELYKLYNTNIHEKIAEEKAKKMMVE